MWSAFRSCRLDSWMRLMCVSKIASGIDDLPGGGLEPAGEPHFGLALGLANGGTEGLVFGQRLELPNRLRSTIQPSPMASVITEASGGFASSRKRRCVTPLVLLLNRPGKSAAKSGTTVRVSSSE